MSLTLLLVLLSAQPGAVHPGHPQRDHCCWGLSWYLVPVPEAESWLQHLHSLWIPPSVSGPGAGPVLPGWCRGGWQRAVGGLCTRKRILVLQSQQRGDDVIVPQLTPAYFHCTSTIYCLFCPDWWIFSLVWCQFWYKVCVCCELIHIHLSSFCNHYMTQVVCFYSHLATLWWANWLYSNGVQRSRNSL